MADKEHFQGFFSYAHIDEETDPGLVAALTTALERRVSAMLTNADFTIWKDTKNLRTGSIWNAEIESAIDSSHVFIIMLTPKWIESSYCRKEYSRFRSVEESRNIGKYVVPLMARTLSRQVTNFDVDQQDIYRELSTRQYRRRLAKDFLTLSDDARILWVEEVADDVEAMIERLRKLNHTTGILPPVQRAERKKREFDPLAHDFRKVDFLSSAEVLVEAPNGSEPRAIYAYLEFLPRMYVQSSNARIEFGIRRATLSIEDYGQVGLTKNEDWLPGTRGQNTYYITPWSTEDSLTICIDPAEGQKALRELPLPPAPGENRLAKIAYAGPTVQPTDLGATLCVSLCPEGLHVFSAEDAHPSPALLRKIEAIINVVAEKEPSAPTQLQRVIPVKERKR